MNKPPHVSEKETRDRRGRVGVRVTIEHEAQGWHGRYQFTTHGMTTQEIIAERDAIVSHHEQKATRLQKLQAMFMGRKIHLSGEWTVTDCTICDRGIRPNVELIIVLRGPDSAKLTMRRTFRSPATIEEDDIVLGLVRKMIREHESATTVGAKHVADVKAALGISGK